MPTKFIPEGSDRYKEHRKLRLEAMASAYPVTLQCYGVKAKTEYGVTSFEATFSSKNGETKLVTETYGRTSPFAPGVDYEFTLKEVDPDAK